MQPALHSILCRGICTDTAYDSVGRAKQGTHWWAKELADPVEQSSLHTGTTSK